jgi:uncharacterized membrane protein
MDAMPLWGMIFEEYAGWSASAAQGCSDGAGCAAVFLIIGCVIGDFWGLAGKCMEGVFIAVVSAGSDVGKCELCRSCEPGLIGAAVPQLPMRGLLQFDCQEKLC